MPLLVACWICWPWEFPFTVWYFSRWLPFPPDMERIKTTLYRATKNLQPKSCLLSDPCWRILESFQFLLNCKTSLEVCDVNGTQHNATRGNSQLPFVWGSWIRFFHEQHWTGAYTIGSWNSLWKETWMQVAGCPDTDTALNTFGDFSFLCLTLSQSRAVTVSDADWGIWINGIDSAAFSSLALHHC